MSILIKGMEMPLSCETCEYKLCVWLMYQKDQVDEIIREYQARSYGLSRKDDCPYIEVPDVHGTNADRIRAMTDEELAKFLCGLTGDCYKCPGDDLCFSTQSPYSNAYGMNVWLRKEVEE